MCVLRITPSPSSDEWILMEPAKEVYAAGGERGEMLRKIAAGRCPRSGKVTCRDTGA